MSGVMTGLFFTATVGGVTLGAWLVGGLFDVAGVNWGLGVCAAAVSLGGAWALSIRPAEGAATRAERPFTAPLPCRNTPVTHPLSRRTYGAHPRPRRIR
jgi:hypothetical protein